MITPWIGVFIAGLGLVASCAAAATVERAEGLPVSRRRLLAVTTCCTLAVALSFLLSRASWQLDAAIAGSTKAARLAQLRSEVAQLEDELHQDVLDRLGGALPTESVYAVAGLLLLAAVATFTLGRPGTLPFARLGPRLRALGFAGRPRRGMEALRRAANEGAWDTAIEIANAIDPRSLGEIESLDRRFVRALAALRLATEGRDAKPLEWQERERLLESAQQDAERLHQHAPDMQEGWFLRGRIAAARGSWSDAREQLAKCAGMPETTVPTDRSVCALRIARERLEKGDLAGAAELDEEVERLGIHHAELPKLRFVRRRRLFQEHLAARRFEEARAVLAQFRDARDLQGDEAATAASAADLLELALELSTAEGPQRSQHLDAFLARALPADLPPVDVAAADAWPDDAVPWSGRLPVGVAGHLLFVQASDRIAATFEPGRGFSEENFAYATEPLLRALQIEPRQRDCLAVLGVLYHFSRPEARGQALGWMQSALDLGVVGAVLRRLVTAARQRNDARRELLDEFRSPVERYLNDPTLPTRLRGALLDELGRFRDFRPILLALDESDAPPVAREPTLAHLRERSESLARLVARLSERLRNDGAGLRLLGREYQLAVQTLTTTAEKVTELEARAVAELGRVVFQ